ncbi:class I SAM-dependent methyltransferase [Catenuloplanes japonicus]|uniref:class I SAM-dependent methyltransferase n=1 Tax=Catenuloplanes japonicus TaxID=33876 RepID=UPI0005270BF4|nr:class I SAM-dependent methyltransferase [Catenuloplanes japonicus]
MTIGRESFERMYDVVGAPPMPWDIGGPQPEVVRLAEAGGFSGDVADIGCGLGGNTVFLASRGVRVIGLDLAPSAIVQARTRAPEVPFDVADALTLDAREARYDTVLDCALYHCLGDEDRRRYAATLHGATRPGARLHVLCFSPEARGLFPTQYLVTEANLRDTLAPHWTVDRLENALYTTTDTVDELRVRAAAILGQAADGPTSGTLTADAHGRVLVPVWSLTATRRQGA